MQNNVLTESDTVEKSSGTVEMEGGVRGVKNEDAARLLQDWMADETGYDEQTWDRVKKCIEDNSLSGRRRFDD